MRGAARPARLVPRPKTALTSVSHVPAVERGDAEARRRHPRPRSCADLQYLRDPVVHVRLRGEPVFEQRLADGPPDDRSGLEQPSRVRVRWMVEHIIHVAGFQQTPGIHDRHLAGDLRDHAEIMGDEQHGKPVFVLQRHQQVEDLRLYRHVEPVVDPLTWFHTARSHCCTPRTPPSSVGSVSLRRCRAETSVTTGKCRMVLPFTLPAICDSPLSQVTSCTYSRPFASDSGCTVAQPTSVFQNHSEVEGFARFDHWAT